MLRKIKRAILAAGAAIFVAVNGALPALAASEWGGAAPASPFTGGTQYHLGFTQFAENLLQTVHVYGMLAGALGIGWGFLVMHNHMNPNAKQRGTEIILTSAVAMIGLFFAPQIWAWLTAL